MRELLLAHGVGRVYESPIPVWLYGVGAGATVAASFLIRALSRDELRTRRARRLSGAGFARGAAVVLKIAGLVGLVLLLLSGALVEGRGLVLAPLLFWVALIVGLTALSAVVQGVWDRADPWRVLEQIYRTGDRPAPVAPPSWLGPLLLYGLFWFELVSGFGFDSRVVAGVALGYTAYVLSLRGRFGDRWVDADPLAILFGFAGRAAPLELRADGLYYKGPIAALDRDEIMPLHLFASLFVLLGATTLDNIRETAAWGALLESARVDDLSPFVVDSASLIALGSVFLLLFAVAIAAAGRSMRADAATLRRRFAWSLVPIGIAYVLAHNAPLLMTGLPNLLREISDPFARGWNLLGTGNLLEAYLPSPALVWGIEVVLIVGGHIIAVLVAHRMAVRAAPDHGAAFRSQIALTALMSVFTIGTLWLLSQPLVV